MAVVLAALAALGACGDDDAAAERAPTFAMDDVRRTGDRVTLPEGEPAVVNFLASWCTPCREELPELQRISGEIAVVGVDVADNRDKAVDLLEDTGATFPVGYDPQRRVASRYRVKGMPTTVFVAADGTEAGRVQGKVTRKVLREWVDRLEQRS